jgi:hypothetical protein
MTLATRAFAAEIGAALALYFYTEPGDHMGSSPEPRPNSSTERSHANAGESSSVS